MEERQEQSKIVKFRKVGEKASEIRGNLSEAAKETFDRLNFLKHFTEVDKAISSDEKEKSLAVINVIKDMKDEDKQAEVLKDYIKGNDRKEIAKTIILAVKYLSGSALIATVAILLKQNNKN